MPIFKYTATLLSAFSLSLLVCIPNAVGGSDVDPVGNLLKLYNTGKYDECQAHMESSVENGSLDVELGELKVKCLLATGNYGETIEIANAILLRNARNPQALLLAYDSYHANALQSAAQRILNIAISVENAFHEYTAKDLVALGRAHLLNGTDPKLVLEKYFEKALDENFNCLEAYLAAGQLGLSKSDYKLAANKFTAGLEQYPNNVDLLFGLGQAYEESDGEKAASIYSRILEINKYYAPVILRNASQNITNEEYDKASNLLNFVLEVNSSNIEAWAYKAVIAHLNNHHKKENFYRDKALGKGKPSPLADYIIGRELSKKRRFQESVDSQKRALAIDINFQPAQLQMARDLLRLGREEEAWVMLERIHEYDKYNIAAYNLLNLKDRLDGYSSLIDDDFVIRMPEIEFKVYGHRAREILLEAKEILGKKYGFVSDRPILVEFFPDQSDFGVRTFGIPIGDGVLGACFGSVITMNSPGSPGAYNKNWESVLWHEFCHVVTLGVTRNKMPRWLSEGISEYEERLRDPRWGERMRPRWREMILEEKRLTTIQELNRIFYNPSIEIRFAYFQSSLVVEYIVETYGDETLLTILQDLGNGIFITEALERNTETFEDLEKNFKAYAINQAENLGTGIAWDRLPPNEIDPTTKEGIEAWIDEQPNNYWALTYYSKLLLEENQAELAIPYLEQIIDMFPNDQSDDNAHSLLARAYRQIEEREKECSVLAELTKVSPEATDAYKRLTEMHIEKENWNELIQISKQYLAVNPMLPTTHRHIGIAQQALQQNEKAIQSFLRCLDLKTNKPADIYYRLALLTQQKDPAASRKHLLEALALAPRFKKAHQMLLQMKMK